MSKNLLYFIRLYINLLKLEKSESGRKFFNSICVTVMFPEQALQKGFKVRYIRRHR